MLLKLFRTSKISIRTKASRPLRDRNPNTCNLIRKRPQNDLDLDNYINTLKQRNFGSNSQNDQFSKVTLVLKLDLDMVKMYHHTKHEVSMSRHSKVFACTDTQTDRKYENITVPHTRAVTNPKVISPNDFTYTDEVYRKYPPSLVAAASVAASRACLNCTPIWNGYLENLTAYRWNLVKPVVDLMHRLVFFWN